MSAYWQIVKLLDDPPGRVLNTLGYRSDLNSGGLRETHLQQNLDFLFPSFIMADEFFLASILYYFVRVRRHDFIFEEQDARNVDERLVCDGVRHD